MGRFAVIAFATISICCGSTPAQNDLGRESLAATEPEARGRAKGKPILPKPASSKSTEDGKERMAVRDARSAEEPAPEESKTRSASVSAISPVTVTLEVTKASGSLGKANTEHVLGMASEAFQNCGVAARLRRGTPLFLSFRISKKGLPSKPRVSGASKGLSTCVTEVLKRMVFPDAPKSSSIAATLNLAVVPSPARHIRGGFGQKNPFSNHSAFHISTLTSVGGLNPNVIRRSLGHLHFRFKHCYQNMLRIRPKIAGTLRARFVVRGDGRTRKVIVLGVDAGVSQCISAALRGMRFPASSVAQESNVEFSAVLRPLPPKP